MNKKKISCLILALGLSLSLAGCGCGNNNTDNTGTNNTGSNGNVVEEGVNKAGNAVKNGVEDVKEGAEDLVNNTDSLVHRMTDTTMEYNKEDLKKALEKDGYKVEETKASKSHFSVDSKDFKVDGETISVYEYDTDDVDTLKKDLGTVTENGAKINGKEVTWNKQAHIYKKGRLIVVYDGNDAKLIKSLNSALGDPLTQTNTTNTNNNTNNTTNGNTNTTK